MTRAYIAIGSNLGDRAATIASGLAALQASGDVRVIRMSSLIETDPVGPPGQGPYLNGAAELETSLAPRELLALLLGIESDHGRHREAGTRNGPRTLDLDLLLYGDRGETVIDEPGLHVPHPRLQERLFVLRPLAEIASDLRHPTLGEGVRSLLLKLERRHVE